MSPAQAIAALQPHFPHPTWNARITTQVALWSFRDTISAAFTVHAWTEVPAGQTSQHIHGEGFSLEMAVADTIAKKSGVDPMTEATQFFAEVAK